MTLASILPSSASDFEKKLDSALAHITDFSIPTEHLWNPWLCPIDALPYLAWAMNVDRWDDNWSEQVKRQVVAVAPEIYRIKGTRRALDLALSALNLSLEVVEWHEKVPRGQRGTFSVNVYSDKTPVTNELAHEVIKTIDNVKRRSAHLDALTVNIKTEANWYVGALTTVGRVITINPHTHTN